jgi:hypothetical protein
MTELVEIALFGIFFLSGLALTYRLITALFKEEKE